MKLLERRRGVQGKDVIDHPSGVRDDRANAIALAVAQVAPLGQSDGRPILFGSRDEVTRAAAARYESAAGTGIWVSHGADDDGTLFGRVR